MTIRAIAFPADEEDKRDKCPTLAFFEEQSEQHPDDFTDLAALLTHSADHGVSKNDSRFKHLTGTDGLYEFKTNGGLRLFCFWDEGKLIVCTHGTVKKRQKADSNEIKRAERMKKDYEKAKRENTLLHVEPKKNPKS